MTKNAGSLPGGPRKPQSAIRIPHSAIEGSTMPTTPRWGFSLPLAGIPLSEHRPALEEAERLGYTDAWSLEVDGTDCFAPLAMAAAWTERMRLGTAIASAFSRGPATLAMSAL